MPERFEAGTSYLDRRHRVLDPRLTLALRISFYAVAAISIASMIATWNEIGAFNRLLDQGTAAAVSAVADAEQLSEGFVTLVLWVGLLTAVLTITWWYRAYGAIERLEPEGLRWSRRWAIGAWLIPFANFVLGKLILDEIDRVSAAADAGDIEWRSRRALPLTAWWWGFWVGGLVLGVIASTTLGGEIEAADFDPANYRFGLWLLMATHAVSAIAAFLGAASIRILGERLHRTDR